ncbi:hypothetical protein BDV96DRAFT_601690 [Lophiotrema nucula]|uniref:C2H2-type domain-containing protein n=1 Tax=Lophiotrema nucula TaxID=690887 RepID=A0A6A5Z1X8_9PLEO|nr:hypothetical protein BDV96DRAFT_601690 [Lophiotrema nucula]
MEYAFSQPDDSQFGIDPDFDMDEAVRVWKQLYPCEGDSHDQSIGCEARSESTTLRFDPVIGSSSEVKTLSVTTLLSNQSSPALPPEHSTLGRIASNRTQDGSFKFESGVRVVEDRSSQSKVERLRCTHQGCTYRGTFRRVYELRRHAKKHSNNTKHPCPVVNCNKTFYRDDKLREHINVAHYHDQIATCPITPCNIDSLPLVLLQLHIDEKHSQEADNFYRLGLRASAKNHCLVKTCRWVGLRDTDAMQVHLRSHHVDERNEFSDEIVRAGFDVATCAVVCPICRRKCPSLQEFVDHLDHHLVKDVPHFRAFQRATDLHTDSEQFSWMSWPNPNRVDAACICGYSAERNGSDIEHQLSLLKGDIEIRPHLADLLNLIPAFSKHPIFQDASKSRHRFKKAPESGQATTHLY